ncbi:MAG: Fe-S cluster assembly sulfur transfer protein SufU [Schleiferilactobacillus perolens]|jgi:nitrogen fixation NifU-like protein|uniref:NIF system FeS cluster assembly NifU N-terminal domain-containing protein n=1 Tax=Schleiferilactobacillus perolens DSM 12744 TaxID=1423792 RepID=A0A0R1N2R4_9LACO|nr:SUF system NifU family Fe-S cluster assembly protein [Schleiferilactobacillus perolens]KRL14252.1 hypothetical protein FD09_GL001419 [Schleiferilactobacillus perolens DSM 12744]MCI1892842.1 SUF system NifU family Fe-S cluster assembly protein [Schleiferilactobacillus harbinensis]MCI1913143.1 SUF system NifU family Fe-S cluster assembly protein [Schleiferilactobacillus harbinensis]
MNEDQLRMLYRQVILDHSQHPHHHGTLSDGSHEQQLENPTCGDVITVQVRLGEDGTHIQDIAFNGSGCTISQASASMMTDVVQGKTIDQARDAVYLFSQMITGDKTTKEMDQVLGDAALLAGVRAFPARIKCATLAWKALDQALPGFPKEDNAID